MDGFRPFQKASTACLVPPTGRRLLEEESLAVVGKAAGLTGSDILKALAGKNVFAVLGDVDYDVGGFDLPMKIKASDLTVGALKREPRPHLSDKVVGMTVVTRP
jgi:hypothetical protein